MSDALETMGKILDNDFPIGDRDAVHVAVICAVANCTLNAGEPVVYKDGKAQLCTSWNEEISVGIVDPFLKEVVREGQKFWLFIKPRTVTSLKHDWDHPAIPADIRTRRKTEAQITQERNEAEEWLKNWAKREHADWDEVLAEIKSELIMKANNTATIDCVSYGTGSTDIPQPATEFWKKVSLVVGVEIVDAPNYFSCSC